MERVAGPREPDIQGRLALCDGAGHRVHELRADFEILEKIAWVGLHHVFSSVTNDGL